MTDAVDYAAAARFMALRLKPGDDLRAGLETAFAQAPEQAGFVAAALGSLSQARLRFAARDDGVEIAGPLEIVALSGTLGVGGVHLHLGVARADGSMAGGHLLEGCAVRTTAEVVMGLIGGVAFERVIDPDTGWRELVIRPQLEPGRP